MSLVVYLLIPTSNHNNGTALYIRVGLYIFWFLHQTTTAILTLSPTLSCISFDSYIKPQPLPPQGQRGKCCISFDSYIKPQLLGDLVHYKGVVYLLIPTSNHNSLKYCYKTLSLYIFWFLHQTTTSTRQIKSSLQLYIFWFLHQTTTVKGIVTHIALLYIFWFLHQTTTWCILSRATLRCISFDSYIKPQQMAFNALEAKSCISFDSYIKPQLGIFVDKLQIVVYLLIPTSNHNLGILIPL